MTVFLLLEAKNSQNILTIFDLYSSVYSQILVGPVRTMIFMQKIFLLPSLWMSTVKASMTTEGPKIDAELVVVAADLLEFLYHNEANIPDIKPISVQPVSPYCVIITMSFVILQLVQMIEDSKSSRPCLRLKMNSSMQSSPANKVSYELLILTKLIYQ